MGGITMEPGSLPYQQDAFRIATVAARDLVEGDVVVLHATEVDAIDLSAGPTDNMVGVVGQEYGGSASATTDQAAGIDARPYLALWGRNIKTRIEDSATVVYGAALAISGTTAGALVTALQGQKVVGYCKKAITSGAVGQFTACDILPPFSGPSLNTYTIAGEIPDVSTAGSFFVPVPEGGTIIRIQAVWDTTVTVADANLSFEIGGTAVTGGGIVVSTGAILGSVVSSTPSAANVVAQGDAIEMITDGASTTASRAKLVFTIQR